MRRTDPHLVLVFMLLWGAQLSAEPILGGHFLEQKTAGKIHATPTPAGKGTVLAHVFNADPVALQSGAYEIGTEITQGQKPQTFLLKPRVEIGAGELQTFRMVIPVAQNAGQGSFRVFTRANGKTIFSDRYSFANETVGTKATHKMTTLYTEAPPEDMDITPPAEVPFESEPAQLTPAANPEKGGRSKASTKTAGKTTVAALTLPLSHGEPGRGSQVGTKPANGKAQTLAVSAAAKAAKPVRTLTPPLSHDGESGRGSQIATVPVTGHVPGRGSQATPDGELGRGTQAATVPTTGNAAGKGNQIVAKPANSSVTTRPTPAAIPAVEEKPRTIDAAEFKTLRTIDEELIIYIIKKGDTLRTIAERYYGNGAKERSIAELNFIDNLSAIKVGEEIIVDVRPLNKAQHPAKGEKRTEAANADTRIAVAEQPASGDCQNYTIQDGDTLAKVAKRFLGQSSKAGLLIKANPSLNPKNLKVGTTIVIPSGKGEKA